VGVDVCVSSWRRAPADVLPAAAKATANYLSAQLIRIEAVVNGYSEGIALDVHGNLSEGSGENVFIVHDGILVTPPLAASILPGITRSTIVTLAHDLGIPVREEVIPRGALYACDEMFLTGTAVEVTPVRSVDHIPVGRGEVGPITRRLQSEFFAAVTGQVPDRHGWLTHVPARVAQVTA
jgi:branched-chain amino acid aminotransferase